MFENYMSVLACKISTCCLIIIPITYLKLAYDHLNIQEECAIQVLYGFNQIKYFINKTC